MSSTRPLLSPVSSYLKLLLLLARQAAVLPLSASTLLLLSLPLRPGNMFEEVSGTVIFNPVFYAILAGFAVVHLLWYLVWKRKIAGVLLGYLALGAVVAYLAWDEPLRYPATVAELYPAQPGDTESSAALLRYNFSHPYTEGNPTFKFIPKINEKATDAEITAYLEQNRAQILAEWERLAPARAWLAELNRFERIGDSAVSYGTLIYPDYSLWRQLGRLHLTHAQLLAREGKGDEAVSLILPLLELTRKTLPASRGSYRIHLIHYLQKQLNQGLPYLLDHAQLSPEMKTRLAAELRKAQRGPETVRLLYLGELPFFHQALATATGSGSGLGKFLSPLVCNPNRSVNELGDLYTVLDKQAARREFAALDAAAESYVRQHQGIVFKNSFGQKMTEYSIPSNRLAQSCWENEDLRAALIARLEKP